MPDFYTCNQCPGQDFLTKVQLIRHIRHCSTADKIESIERIPKTNFTLRTGLSNISELKSLEEQFKEYYDLGLVTIKHRKLQEKSIVKRLANPLGNKWHNFSINAKLSSDGVTATATPTEDVWETHLFAEQCFALSEKFHRKDDFHGTIVYYFEIKIIDLTPAKSINVGLSATSIPFGKILGTFPNSYGIPVGRQHCLLFGEKRPPKLPGNVEKFGDRLIGCGLLINSKNEVAIFFTGNGILMGKQIPIDPQGADFLYPYVTIRTEFKDVPSLPINVIANFGDPSKPFKYDVFLWDSVSSASFIAVPIL